MINDCNQNVHFSEILFKNSSTQLNDSLSSLLKANNEEIFREFSNTNKMINTTLDLQLISDLANLTGQTTVVHHSRVMKNDCKQVQRILKQIVELNSTLPANFLEEIINQVRQKQKVNS